MSLAVVTYPSLSDSDFEWIQSIRKDQDELFYDVVNPHFTLVFPTEKPDANTLIRHTESVVAKFQPFDFVARCVTVGDPDFWDHAHVFLIPDEGFSDIVKLHDAFYTGPLRSELRLDLPFVPHIGIASKPEPESCKKLVDELNSKNFEIQGSVDVLDIIKFDGESTETIEQVNLS